MRSIFALLICVYVAIAASVKDHKSPHVLWSQHEAVATYTSVAVSRKGYAIAGTWLNEPEVAEIFKIDKGNKTRKSIGDANAKDNSIFNVAMSADDTIAVAVQSSIGNTTSFIYRWDASDSNKLPDWTQKFNGVIASVAVSADGTVIAVVGMLDVSKEHPNNLALLLYDGYSGKELNLRRVLFPDGYQGGNLVISGDGKYVALEVADPSGAVTLNVYHQSGKKHSHSFPNWDLTHPNGQAIAISGDGTYLAAGQANSMNVYKLASHNFSYPLYFSTTLANFYVASNCLAFSRDSSTLAVGYLRMDVMGVTVSAYSMTSKELVLNYVYPAATGADQNMPAMVQISENGQFVAVATWGTQNNDPGTEQIQVFDTTSKKTGPIFAYFTPGSMFGIGVAVDRHTGSALVVAGGKNVHANQMGNGGDMFAVSIPTNGQLLL